MALGAGEAKAQEEDDQSENQIDVSDPTGADASCLSFNRFRRIRCRDRRARPENEIVEGSEEDHKTDQEQLGSERTGKSR
jgi:hypothetical protein